jgi:hypothetical protein
MARAVTTLTAAECGNDAVWSVVDIEPTQAFVYKGDTPFATVPANKPHVTLCERVRMEL